MSALRPGPNGYPASGGMRLGPGGGVELCGTTAAGLPSGMPQRGVAVRAGIGAQIFRIANKCLSHSDLGIRLGMLAMRLSTPCMSRPMVEQYHCNPPQRGWFSARALLRAWARVICPSRS